MFDQIGLDGVIRPKMSLFLNYLDFLSYKAYFSLFMSNFFPQLLHIDLVLDMDLDLLKD